MLRILLKKQLLEVFRGYFYDSKKNRMRSKLSIAGMFVLFFIIMVVLLGGIFTAAAVSMCEPLAQVGMSWLYFLLMSGIAILLGAFGSVFNSYTSLYLSNDNELLLSLPIPFRVIISARLMNVYLMGMIYTATAFIPTLIVYWVVTGATVSKIICGILMFLIVTVIVMLLSCVLGWVVAKISLRLRNKSFITVIISLAFIGAYYIVYFRANEFLQNLIMHADEYGDEIKGAAYGLYLFGRIGEGYWVAAILYTVISMVLMLLVWRVLSRSFLSIATASGKARKVRYVEKQAKQRNATSALIRKEFARFTSSANYMLNCGLGILFIPICGVMLLLRGKVFCTVIDGVFTGRPGTTAIIICTAFCMFAAMNDMAAPSISLEGKSIWIPQSLPVMPGLVLKAKASVQLILTAIPTLFAALCAVFVINDSPTVKAMIVVESLVYAAFSAVFSTFIGVKMPILSWTNEIAPIKQGGAVTVVLFSSWGIGVAFAAIYLIIGYKIGAAIYLLICTVIFAVAALAMLRWLDTRGAKEFASL